MRKPTMTALALSLLACNSEVTSDSPSGSGGDTPTSSSSTGAGGMVTMSAQPPEPGAMHAGDGPGAVFAMRKIYLGDTDPDGTPNIANGWKQYGYDIDQRASTEASTDLCKPSNSGATKNAYPDGNLGIDNSHGRNVLPIILGIASNASTQMNESLNAGNWSLLTSVEALGMGSDYNPLSIKLYGGAQVTDATMMPTTPKFDGTDVWPVRSDSLEAPPDLGSASSHTESGYVTGQVVVAKNVDLSLPLSISGFTIMYRIHGATVTMELDAAHTTAAKGIISGVLDTEELAAEFQKVAGQFDPSLCSGPTIESILTQIRQASDIMKDGTQDPTKTCDGISIGLGFEAVLVQLGGVSDVEPPPDPCQM